MSSRSEVDTLRQLGLEAYRLRLLRGVDNLSLSIATGGWRRTALMKLESARIDSSGLPMASLRY